MSTFEPLDGFDNYAPDIPEPYDYSPLDFDPKKAIKKKLLVKYIDDNERAMKTLLDSVHADKQLFLDSAANSKKELIDFDKNAELALLDFDKQATTALLEYDKEKKKVLIGKGGGLHGPHLPKKFPIKIEKEYKYPPHKPAEHLYPIPLTPDLPNYEIADNKDKSYQSDYSKTDYIPAHVEPEYSAPKPDGYGSGNPDPQYTDPFHTWTSENLHGTEPYSARSSSNEDQPVGMVEQVRQNKSTRFQYKLKNKIISGPTFHVEGNESNI